jgi:2-methylcitrate dehydratase PrpD
VTGSNPGAPTVSEALARWVAGLEFDRLPQGAVRMARRCLLDTLGCALQGSTTPEAALLLKVREDLGGSGPCTVWGLPGSAPAQVAALLNGTHAHLRELDDIGCGGHAGACQVPAALAAAELAGADGRAVLLGLIAGHEITSRLTDAASYDTMTLGGWHTTGVYGALGAAAAAARVMGLDAAGTAHALGLAGSYVGGTWAFMADGAMSKRVHPGKSAETGLTAAVLARRGVTGPREVLDAAWGGLFETYVPGQADHQAPLKDLGNGFRIMKKGVKPYPVCWGINSAADSMLKLRAEHALTAGTVRRVRIVLSEMSRRMIGTKRVESVLDAQMSVAYALAWIILRGKLTLDEFSAEALRDPGVRALMGKIELEVDPAAHGERQTVEVETTAGRRLSSRVEIPRGHWEDPLSDDELRAKFLALATPAVASRADMAADLVNRIESPGALTELLTLLRGQT